MARKKDVTVHDRNPFIEQLAGMQTRKKRVTVKAGMAIVDGQTGEWEEAAEVVAVHQVDKAQFVKVFTSNLRQFFNLKPSTYKLLQVLLFQLGQTPQKGAVYLNLSVVEQYFSALDEKPIARASYHVAVKEMIQKGFIAESRQPNLYWINPALFFNGDRVRFVKEYRNMDAKQSNFDLPDDGTENAFIAPPAAIEEAAE